MLFGFFLVKQEQTFYGHDEIDSKSEYAIQLEDHLKTTNF